MPSGDSKDPLTEKANLNNALWILDLILSFESLPESLAIFTTKYVLNPLMVLTHKTKEADLKIRLLNIIRDLMVKPVSTSTDIEALAKLLTKEM